MYTVLMSIALGEAVGDKMPCSLFLEDSDSAWHDFSNIGLFDNIHILGRGGHDNRETAYYPVDVKLNQPGRIDCMLHASSVRMMMEYNKYFKVSFRQYSSSFLLPCRVRFVRPWNERRVWRNDDVDG